MNSPEQEGARADRLLKTLDFLDELRPAIVRARRGGWLVNVALEAGDEAHRFTISGEFRVPEDPPTPERGASDDAAPEGA